MTTQMKKMDSCTVRAVASVAVMPSRTIKSTMTRLAPASQSRAASSGSLTIPKKQLKVSLRQVKTEFTGAGDYFCLMLNILHHNVDDTYSRKDWALAANCNLRKMRMFGEFR